MSSYWNYRILARKIDKETQYGFYEVHYENDIPIACTENPVFPIGFDEDEDPVQTIKWQLDAMKLASEKTVLNYDNFPVEYLTYSRKKKLKAIGEYIQQVKNIIKR